MPAKVPTKARPRGAETKPDSPPRPADPTTGHRFTIVGVGASAGGLEAFTSLLSHVGDGDGMALVLIQHLDPTHTSFLREALVKTTTMTVVHAAQGMRVEPRHVYVIPPNTCLGVRDGLLTLALRDDDPKLPNLPVDYFFRTLAAERGSGAIGVVLSGTASDGTEGLRTIKEAEGITFAQEPRSAKFAGMPQSAVDAGVVDACLPLPELANELVRLCHHPYVIARAPGTSPSQTSDDAATYGQIFALVQAATGVDFGEYKAPTLERRIARRMALQHVGTIAAYLTLLQRTPDEVVALYEDSLIHVTSFFRDPEVFESLKAHVFPVIVREKPERSPIRIWVPGCSTGEEVYSLAIALVEFLGERSRPVQLFGSDVSRKAIETARAGLYPDSALRDVTDVRRRRYFTKVERGYRIAKSIRDLCVFVQHDLARDPPFSKIDLTSCRNVLIYFDEALQKRVVPTLHHSLQRPGFLLLGRAESISGFKQLFETVDKANKIFGRSAVASTLHFTRRVNMQRTDTERARDGSQGLEEPRARGQNPDDLSRRLDRLLLGRYAPPGVVVNDSLEVLQFLGETGDYLQPAPGEPQNNLLQMARGSLAMTLRSAVAAAKKGTTPMRAAGVALEQKRFCDVVVIPLVGAQSDHTPLYVILFEDGKKGAGRGTRPTPVAERGRGRTPKLEQELAATKEYLAAVIAQHGRTNEDLGSANEELVSGNEELQSMNEELETAKEELQSINEELTTVNDELQVRNHEVTQINSDLVNLLATFDLPILMLDIERRIRRFTPKARRILNVVATDIGRAFGDIKPNIDVPDLDAQIAEVIETMAVKESEVQDRDGHWHRLQIRPYKTTENKIDGAILSLFDIDALKNNVQTAELATLDSVRANDTKDEFLATLSHELRTPLSSMLMRAQLLRRGGMDETKVKQAGASIEAGVKRQVQLIEDLLDVSRIVTDKLKMNELPVDLGRVITAAVDGLSVSIERKAIKLEVELPAGKPARTVLGDDARLQQVVVNLLANAIKFTPERGTVTVSLVIGDETAILRVKDTGMGIEPEFLGKVFNRFAQGDSTNTKSYGGLGLGLAIVKHLVERHHGTVIAESAGRGLGATFTVTLPLMSTQRVSPPPPSQVVLPPAPADTSKLHGLRILIMEDDRATREALSEMLTRTGAVVQLTSSSSEAITAVPAFRPELLLCDIAMPGEDGYGFIRRLRGLGIAEAGTVPALALTALAREEDRERALAAGFQMHLTKPVDIDQLTAAVLELTARRDDSPVA